MRKPSRIVNAADGTPVTLFDQGDGLAVVVNKVSVCTPYDGEAELVEFAARKHREGAVLET